MTVLMPIARRAVEPLPHAALDDVLEMDHAERPRPLRDHQRRPAGACNPVDDGLQFVGNSPAVLLT